tara:strand:- start:39 stop:770 length:732 start_codon:yes stop_codon:yes gene_type:complete
MYDVKYFPSTCVDNFFSNPDKIKEWGLSLEKQPDENGKWPGTRTKPLHEIDSEFSNELILKVISSYIDLKYNNISWGKSVTCFQEITPYKEEIKNIGWIHQDIGMQLAFIIYLTPEADTNSGTSLFNLKTTNSISIVRNQYLKEKLFKGEEINENEYKNSILKQENLFIEKTKFANVYNRMIAYDSSEFHRANSFTTNANKRLTLVGFVKDIVLDDMPLQRVRDKIRFDNVLEKRIDVLQNNR